MENIKEAFLRVKEDVFFLKKEINSLTFQLVKSKENINNLSEIIYNLNKENLFLKEKNEELSGKVSSIFEKYDEILEFQKICLSKLDTFLDKQTNNSTNLMNIPLNPMFFKTYNYDFKPLNAKILDISIGNQGVQTDKQTDKQTDVSMNKSSYNHQETKFDEAQNLLNSLDSIKKEIRLKFKRLTDQELLVFSTIYQLEEEFGYSDYKSISKRLNLSESSIRDYVRRLTIKGIPLVKEKINNKEIKLNVSQNLKKLVTLNTILELRDL